MKLLVDGDILVYRAGFANDKTLYDVYVGDSPVPQYSSTVYAQVKDWIKENAVEDTELTIDRSPVQGSEVAALSNAKQMLEQMIDITGPDEVQVYIDGPGNFRTELATYRKYKGNRDKMRRPVHYQSLKNYLVNHWGAISVEGQETDDELACNQNTDTIICSIDKDLLQIPGQHFNFVKKEHIHVDLDSSVCAFWKQVLTGDASDNIFGCPGVGDKTAIKILSNCRDYFNTVVDVYKAKLPKKLPEDMICKDNILAYDHCSTGKPVYKSIEEYVEEVADLIYIKRDKERTWRDTMIT